MSVLQLFQKPRIVRAELLAAPIAIAGGRSALRLVIEGAGVLLIGDLRHRFWRGFDGVVQAPIADAIGGAIAVRVTNLAGTAERAVAFVPLPAMPPAPRAPTPVAALFAPIAPPRVALRPLAISVHTRGSK